jgi:hypothetical protein
MQSARLLRQNSTRARVQLRRPGEHPGTRPPGWGTGHARSRAALDREMKPGRDGAVLKQSALRQLSGSSVTGAYAPRSHSPWYLSINLFFCWIVLSILPSFSNVILV